MAEAGRTQPAPRIGASAILSYVGGLITPAPRLVGFAITEGRRARIANGSTGQDSAAIPPLRLTPTLLALAALDEWTVAVMKTPGRMPTDEGFDRVTAEVGAAHDLYARNGWIDDPASFHAAPPALSSPVISRSRL